MKKFILGIAWQCSGFLGAVMLVIAAALAGPWDYNGITGLLGALLGMRLIWPLAGCVLIVVLGGLLCLQTFRAECDASKNDEQ